MLSVLIMVPLAFPGKSPSTLGADTSPVLNATPRNDQGLFSVIAAIAKPDRQRFRFHDLFLSCRDQFAVKILTVTAPPSQQISHHHRKAVEFCGKVHPPSIASTPMASSFPPLPPPCNRHRGLNNCSTGFDEALSLP